MLASRDPFLSSLAREHFARIAQALHDGRIELSFIINDYNDSIMDFSRLPCVDINHLVTKESIFAYLNNSHATFGYESLLKSFDYAASSGLL